MYVLCIFIYDYFYNIILKKLNVTVLNIYIPKAPYQGNIISILVLLMKRHIF